MKYYLQITILISLIFLSCDPAIYLNLRTTDERFNNVQARKRELLTYKSTKIDIKIFGMIHVSWFEKEKKGAKLGFEIDVKSKENFIFDLSQSFLLDSLAQKFEPSYHSIYRKDNQYKANKTHEMGIVFMSDYHDGMAYFKFPLSLHIPPIIFDSDSLVFPTIEVN